MALETEDTGFLSRWSRRKALVRQGAPVAEATAKPSASTAVVTEPVTQPVTQPEPLPAQVTGQVTGQVAASNTALETATESAPSNAAEPAPTLADVAGLTRDSDFTRFVGRSVQPDVKNAALGKLFTDPHFNVMDGLDVYIDDYGKPDPLPPGMLRQMLQAHVLGLFDEEDKEQVPPSATAGDTALATAPAAAPDGVPSPSECQALPHTPPESDENTDLQLQPDDDAGRTGPAPGAEQDPGCADRRA